MSLWRNKFVQLLKNTDYETTAFIFVVSNILPLSLFQTGFIELFCHCPDILLLICVKYPDLKTIISLERSSSLLREAIVNGRVYRYKDTNVFFENKTFIGQGTCVCWAKIRESKVNLWWHGRKQALFSIHIRIPRRRPFNLTLLFYPVAEGGAGEGLALHLIQRSFHPNIKPVPSSNESF